MHGARLDAVLKCIRERLAGTADSAPLDAELLLAHALAKPRSYLRAWPERTLSRAQAATLSALLDRRLAGEPLAYLLGRREFWSLELEISPGVLIPRADTETLVERALQLLPSDRPVRVADLGTGSGAIALAIAGERPLSGLVATDRAATALAIARRNATRLHLKNVEFRHGDWCAALGRQSFDLIVSNPPYIALHDPHLTQGDLPHEPIEALASGADGLDDIRAIIGCATQHLTAGGYLLLEHGHDQGAEIRALLQRAGYADVRTRCDLERRERISEGRSARSGTRATDAPTANH
ncbi:protein-(glutamine-N5) methyltransferase, release factor-specific [Acidihalobacter ferrooxydans]|uniref:Release factor glutamine methyltransferase n=2 Tax=Acidihalobacter ferrooxydans TaxID=1765967 RepID=A0A1P8UGE3_9GAMM|nr:protein-(glutamine-N5) methyltransferase, release factor-specific [Acidihalobacter ferrooxydans]